MSKLFIAILQMIKTLKEYQEFIISKFSHCCYISCVVARACRRGAVSIGSLLEPVLKCKGHVGFMNYKVYECSLSKTLDHRSRSARTQSSPHYTLPTGGLMVAPFYVLIKYSI